MHNYLKLITVETRNQSLKIKRFFTLLLIFVAASNILMSQTQANNDGTIAPTFHYKLLVEAPIYECDIAGRQLDTTLYAAPASALFTKIGTSGDNVIVRFWIWGENQIEKQETLNYKDSTKVERKYFLLPTSEFQTKAIPRYSKRPAFSLGTIVIPVKLRKSPFDFSTDVTLGPAGGIRFRMSPYTNTNFVNILGGFGVTHVTLDSISTGGIVSQTSDKPAVTFSLGGVFEFSSAQIGVFVGWDYISQNNQFDWRYQGKPWLSIGLGYAIISRNSISTPSNEGANND